MVDAYVTSSGAVYQVFNNGSYSLRKYDSEINDFREFGDWVKVSRSVLRDFAKNINGARELLNTLKFLHNEHRGLDDKDVRFVYLEDGELRHSSPIKGRLEKESELYKKLKRQEGASDN